MHTLPLTKIFRETIENETGIVSIMTLMIVVALTIGGIVAISIANNEAQIVRNEQISNIDFYQAESGINDARINYINWMDDDFLTTEITSAKQEIDSVATDSNGDPLASMQIRCIESTATPVFSGGVADRIPAMNHIAPPPAGSGYSVKYFETRRYSITATSNNGGTVVQTGVWKVFNKF